MAKKRKNRDNHSNVLFRFWIISMVILLVFALPIFVKLFSTTVVHADDWNAKAQKELSRVDTILPDRGDILARDGSILATNLRYYTVRLDFRSERFAEDSLRLHLPEIADSMAVIFPQLTAKEWRDSLEAPLRREPAKRSRGWRVVSNISYADLQALRALPFFNMTNANKNGLTVETRLRRRNPYGDMARRSVGGVGQTSTCRQIHGISGLEKALDSLLYGKPGIAKKVPLTRNIVNWTDIPPTPGYSLLTTIDINLQDIVENELNRMLDSCSADWGCAILMEVKTGDIVAISNLERNKKGPGYVEALNYAVVGFEPGSVVKPISMMIALEDGIVSNLEEVIPIGKSWAYGGGRPITDSHYNGSLKVREVIEQSSNIGMARIVVRGYNDRGPQWVKRLEKAGFFDPLNTGIAGEAIPYYRKDPKNVDLARMAYGYTSRIPPLYTMAMYNAMANDGRFVRPRLVRELISENFDSVIPVSYVRDRVCSHENARKMQYMLRQVVDGAHGTGRRLRNDLVPLAGKTGTCYSVDPATRQYNKSRKRLAFCGFFPADNPQYTCMVLTFWPKRNMFGAASTSGEVLKNIALKMYSRGLLGNSSDYAADAVGTSTPELYGSLDPGRHKRVKKAAALSKAPHAPAPKPTTAGTVPCVRGLGLREAVTTLEDRGYEVTTQGSGYVRSQMPQEGQPLPRGSRIMLALAP